MGGAAFIWTDADGNPTKGRTIWSIGEAHEDDFAPSASPFMINYRSSKETRPMARVARRWRDMFSIIVAAVVLLADGDLRAGEMQTGTSADEAAIRKIIQNEVAAWNRGDAAAYSRQFAADGTFTNIRGQFFTGYDAFLKQHEVIFAGIFKGSVVQQDIVALRFIGRDVAIVETLNSVSGMRATSQGTLPDDKGRLRTRLLQVVARHGGEWKIVAYHNADVKPGVPVPEPK
jgi:uncharacterized protein (TIGR02246 family)